MAHAINAVTAARNQRYVPGMGYMQLDAEVACKCGVVTDGLDAHAQHVAELVQEELDKQLIEMRMNWEVL